MEQNEFLQNMAEREKWAFDFLIFNKANDIPTDERRRSEKKLKKLIKELGPVVIGHPSWHPLCFDERRGTQWAKNYYLGLDHTIAFAHGILTCPYDKGGVNGQDVIDSVESLPINKNHSVPVTITTERLDDVFFYSKEAVPILIRCVWHDNLPNFPKIPKNFAIPLMLEQELPSFYHAQCGETWDSMADEFLGSPRSNLLSPFVSTGTANAMRTVWDTLVHTGVFNGIKIPN